MSDSVVGIDLGTTNSAVAILKDGQPFVIPIEGQATMPSCVGLDAKGELIVGRAALNQLVASPENTVLSIKRLMGTGILTKLGENSYGPEEISSFILRALKKHAEDYLGTEVKKAVITVPAFFDEGQRKATTQAAELAGLEVLRIINEPTAAALAYDATHHENEKLLVYDLGGGTFDVSVVVVEGGVVEVKASHGDTKLGGDDFDAKLVEHAVESFKKAHGVDPSTDLTARRRMKVIMERAKCELTDDAYVRIQEDFLFNDKHLNLEVTRPEYEEMIATYLERTLQCIDQAMKDASLLPNQLDKILLVGGASRTPAVTELIESHLGILPSAEVNPDLIVAMGAAIQAGALSGIETGSVLVDITPHTFRLHSLSSQLGFPEMVCVPIIRRNSALPAAKSDMFRTVHDNQAVVDIEVFQGESERAEENTLVGKFSVEGLSKVRSGNVIIVRFELDLNGMLKVTATEKDTGLSKQVVMDTRESGHQLDMQMAMDNVRRLHPEALDIGELRVVDSEWEDGDDSESLIKAANDWKARVEALIAKEISPDDEQELKELLTAGDTLINEKDWEALKRNNERISDILFYLED